MEWMQVLILWITTIFLLVVSTVAWILVGETKRLDHVVLAIIGSVLLFQSVILLAQKAPF